MILVCVITFTIIAILVKKNTTECSLSEVPKFSGSDIGFIVATKIIKKPEGFPSKLETAFFVLGAHMHFHSKSQVIISLFGVLDFDVIDYFSNS